MIRVIQDKRFNERDYDVYPSDNNISFGNDMSKFTNKCLQLLHSRVHVRFNFNIIPASNTFDDVICGIVGARAESEMLISFYNALIDMFKFKIYLQNANNFTFKIEFHTRLTTEKEYLQCIFNKHQTACLIYRVIQIDHSICFGVKIAFVNSNNNNNNANEYEKTKYHFEHLGINPLKSSLDFCRIEYKCIIIY